MARDEDEPQQIVADVVVDGGIEIRDGGLLLRESSSCPSCSCLRSSSLLATQQIDRAMLGGRHEPRAGIVGHARCPAISRARSRARPARDPRPGRCRARCARGRRSAFADSIRQTASMARCASVAAMGCNQASDHRQCKSEQERSHGPHESTSSCARGPDLDRCVRRARKARRDLDCFLHVARIDQIESRDELLRFGEGPIHDGAFAGAKRGERLSPIARARMPR